MSLVQYEIVKVLRKKNKKLKLKNIINKKESKDKKNLLLNRIKELEKEIEDNKKWYEKRLQNERFYSNFH